MSSVQRSPDSTDVTTSASNLYQACSGDLIKYQLVGDERVYVGRVARVEPGDEPDDVAVYVESIYGASVWWHRLTISPLSWGDDAGTRASVEELHGLDDDEWQAIGTTPEIALYKPRDIDEANDTSDAHDARDGSASASSADLREWADTDIEELDD